MKTEERKRRGERGQRAQIQNMGVILKGGKHNELKEAKLELWGVGLPLK